ncbi:MAG: ABC transporter substrate-binding protein [Desulfomonile tiedjei]|uniref:ABC transporter substrate-binding protein n=1 Tax=Desulfomonile tiedjei TaxID=2358 RepID=A0A9D6Z5J4_9BACT|nr:ABC transporter substrate-binding protein [Desulfomonile tiedjei]
MKPKSLLSLLILFLLTAGEFIWHCPCRAADMIRLGFVADATGVGESWYKSQKAGIDLFIEETNAAGGVLGKKLELIVRDSALKPDLGEAAAEDLIVNEKCDFLIGPTSSGVALRVTKVAQKHKKIVIFHTSNTEGLTTSDFQPYMFQVVPNTGIESRGLAQFFAVRQYKRFSYLGPDYEYARNWWSNFKSSITKVKPDVQILSEQWVKLGVTEFEPNIPTIVKDNPEIVITNLWGESLAKFIRQVKPSGLLDRASITSLFDLDMLKSLGMEMPEGILGYTRCPFYGVRDRKMQQFVEKFYARYRDWPADWAIMAYDGLFALVEAIKKAGSLDSDKVVRALEGLHFKSLRGDRFIRAEDHMADVGVYVGWTTKSPKYENFMIMKNVTLVPADTVWMAVDEVKKLQPRKP